MKIAIVTLVLIEENQLDYYNPQSIGLARAIAKVGNNVSVYSIEETDRKSKRTTKLMNNLTLYQIPAKGIGRNSIGFTKYLDYGYDVVICFSDIQLGYKSIVKWCKKNDITLYPYVGVIKSRQDSKIKRFLMEIIAKRNINLYRKQLVFAKTEKVYSELKDRMIKSIIATVGLDMNCMKEPSIDMDITEIKQALGFHQVDEVILFVGRLVNEKRPLELLDIFHKLSQENPNYKLCMIGQGELEDKVLNKIEKLGLKQSVCLVDLVPNNMMWRYFKISSYYVNLNLGEIFGMAILEAMFYNCRVVARRAPGPEMIITNKVDGYLCDNDIEIVQCIIKDNVKSMGELAHDKILKKFTWENTAEIMLSIIQKQLNAKK